MRFRWARARGHPAWVWPDVDREAWRASLKSIARVVGELLAPDARGTVRLDRPAGADPRTVGVAALTSGTGPLLGHWLERGRLEMEDPLAALFRLHIAHGRRRAERTARELDRALEPLAAAGIHAVVLKGAHTSRAYFPEPGSRPSVDIDLFVPLDALGRAERALGRAGYVEEARQPRLSRSSWQPPGEPAPVRSLEVFHAEGPLSVDLHGSLDRDFGVRMSGLEDADTAAMRPWPGGHPAASVLDQPLLTAYLAAHASNELTHLTLLRLVELTLVVEADDAAGRLRWEELHALLAQARARRFAYPGLALVERLVPGTIPGDFLGELEAAAPRRLVRVVGRLDPATAQRLDHLSLEERFMWAHGPFEHVRRALQMIWPARIGSFRRLLQTYAERARRIARGRVGWRAGDRR